MLLFLDVKSTKEEEILQPLTLINSVKTSLIQDVKTIKDTEILQPVA